MVLSVSKTYIRLKDLILEKKFLQKETKKLKNLNSHLENRLGEQEKRLSTVSIELNKTWNLVGRMQRQHRQLHTNEQVLRYQLQQKRRMLGELKEELEYCRRKWALAKEKNKESQSQWESLRLEFIKRKELDGNNSAESGYSDNPISDEDGDDEEEEEDNSDSLNARRVKGNTEKFLLEINKNDRKILRLQSASPVRNAKIIVTRRNSESHITQFATEEFQSQTDVVQPIVNICAECGENCAIHSVHFDTPQNSSQVKVTEAVVCNAKQSMTNAKKLIEAKTLVNKTKMCCEMRRDATMPSTRKTEESLEDMFMRLSGQQQDCSSIDSSGNECDTSSASKASEENIIESQTETLERIQCLEVECQSLLEQVTRASSRGVELKQRIEEVQNRCKSEHSCSNNEENTSYPQPSTSQVNVIKKTDEECLTENERAYTERRNERLKRLEEESKAFLNKMKSSNDRAVDVENKLKSLHDRYGSGRQTTSANNDNNQRDENNSTTNDQQEHDSQNKKPSDNHDDDDEQSPNDN